MRRLLRLALIFAAVAAPLAAQEAKPAPSFGISFSGFVKTTLFYDSRQTVAIREGDFLLYPRGPLPDAAGADLNAAPSFNILSIQTRLTGRITGPDVLGARTSALFEGEFFGHSDPDINGFRLRHGYLKLNWARTELLIGQYWHPLFVVESFPDVVSFNTGAPFQPFNRSPQVRLTGRFGRLSVTATALGQRDFQSTGPDGASTIYARNAVVPELGVLAQYSFGDPASGAGTLAGGAIDYLALVPRLATPAGYKTSEKVGGLTAMGFVKHRRPGWTVKAQAVYGRNVHHLTMLGGYAVSAIADPERQVAEYAPARTLAAWVDAHTNGSRWQAGLFGGWSKNLGTADPAAGPRYVRGADIDVVYRISPRLVFNTGKMRFATEAEYTAASYGTPGADLRVSGAEFTGGFRLLLAAVYSY